MAIAMGKNSSGGGGVAPLPNLTGVTPSRGGGNYILTFTGLQSGCRIYCKVGDDTRQRWIIPTPSTEYSGGDPGFQLFGVDVASCVTPSIVNIGDNINVYAYQWNPLTGAVSALFTSSFTAT